ncbi:MAG TPA: glycosyltransferase N-terminal domain-containing protein [Flavobacteriales bacterium]|nr:glycosyltransferase N-terminal domain-containing protein [Flavobacteriales bacterium]
MPLLYDIGTALYHLGIRAAAPFVPKARQWVDGRRAIWRRLEAKSAALQGCLWMHCASVGEFEQGRPVLEAIKAERPDLPVLLTFFSPSGYEARRDLALATHVEYLPPDGVVNAERLLRLIEPRAALFIKYEFWYHHLMALSRAGVPTFLVSAIFRPEQTFFRWFGGTHRAMLRSYRHLFVQDEASRALLASIGVTNVTVSGDTRFDRVAAIAKANEDLPIAAGFKGPGPSLIGGSTWPKDEALLLEALRELQRVPKCVIVPHELNEDHLLSIESAFPKPLARWSELEGATTENIATVIGAEPHGTLLVDRMGLLARLYKYGTVAYIGGGFGDGIHSLLEAAAWGVPVIFGPNHHKFAEAKGLIDAGGGFEVRDAQQLTALLGRLLSDPEALNAASKAAGGYVRERIGATHNVVARVLEAV